MSAKNFDLGKDNVGKLLVKLAVPAIIAQLVNVLYNIIDRMFIGRMPNGDLAMAGVGVAFPIIILVSAFSALIGYGGAPLVAIKMGEKDNDGAEKLMSNSFSVLIILAVILIVGFLMFKIPILKAFGASDNIIAYADDYITIYLAGTIFVLIAVGMNPFINTQGFARTGMYTVLIGAITNIVLDPILIFGFSLGIKGAALATVISQGVSAIWVLFFLFGKKSTLKIRKKYLVPDFKLVGKIMALGVSPFIMQATESLVLISLNTQLMKFGGDLAVSAMTIMSSIMQIITLPIMGLCQGGQPIVSYNFGAKSLERVKKAFRLVLITSLSFTTVICGALLIKPEMFVRIFNNDPALMKITCWSIRIYFAGIFIFGAQMACQQTFLALGQAKISLILALLRKVILLVPLIFIIPNFIDDKLKGVLLAEPIADIFAATTTIIVFSIFYKKTLSGTDEKALE
ncbi:MAG: MATE family efflux transporter [Clostridium sp.]|nr:MATE family efflux transporter [Clostridium sp.]MDU7082737.1 MATE family efflux transporter [Clostridium sp.]